MELEDRQTVCKVCHVQFARYICPRCNIAYCGLPCYKQHSTRCTEAFYREQAVGQLKGTKADNAEKKKVLRALQRVQLQRERDEAKVAAYANASGHQDTPAFGGELGLCLHQSSSSEFGGSSDEEERSVEDGGPGSEKDDWLRDEGSGDSGMESSGEEDNGSSGAGRRRRGMLSSTTLHRLVCKAKEEGGDLSNADLEQLLSPADLQAFRRQLAIGRLGHLVRPWAPWWLSKEAQGLRLSAAGGKLVLEAEQGGRAKEGDADARAVRGQQGEIEQQGSGGQHGGHAGEGSGRMCGAGRVGEERGMQGQIGESDEHRDGSGVDGEGPGLPDPPEEPLHPLSALTKAQPSPLLQWQVVELLYAYCHTMRQYNGQPLQPDVVAEATEAVLHLSQALAACMPAHKPAAHPKPASQATPSTPAGGAPPAEAGEGAQQNRQGPVPGAGGAAAAAAADAGRPLPSAAGGAAAPEYDFPQSAAQVVLSCLERACLPPVGDIGSRAMAVAILSDVAALLALGSSAVVLALTDLRRLVACASAMWATQVQEMKQAVREQHRQCLFQQQQQVQQEEGSQSSSFQQLRQQRGQQKGKQLMLHRLQQAQQLLQQQMQQLSSLTKRHGLLQAMARKLWFFMCWAHEQRSGNFFQGLLRAAVVDQWHLHQATITKPKSKHEALLDSIADHPQQQVKPLIVEQTEM